MKLFKATSSCLNTIITKTTSVIERSLNVVDHVVEAGEVLAKDFADETKFDVLKSTKEREALMAEFEAELKAMS
jgi:hypothetical protein